MDQPAFYPEAWDLPVTREPRLCADRALERQLDFMRSRGWPVEKPVLRITTDPGLIFWARGLMLNGGTFELDSSWHVLMPAGAERELCRNETRTRAGLLPDGVFSIETLFHELAHQVVPGERAVTYRGRRLTVNYMRHIQRTRVRLWPVTSWRTP